MIGDDQYSIFSVLLRGNQEGAGCMLEADVSLSP